jgi:hypothetical protein
MATIMHDRASHRGTAMARAQMCAAVDMSVPWDELEDSIMSDIETRGRLQGAPSKFGLGGHRILSYLSDSRNLGPISVLIILAIYSLLSPLLPAPVHEYIYHILH